MDAEITIYALTNGSTRLNEMCSQINQVVNLLQGIIWRYKLNGYEYDQIIFRYVQNGYTWKVRALRRGISVYIENGDFHVYVGTDNQLELPMSRVIPIYQTLQGFIWTMLETFPWLSKDLTPFVEASHLKPID